MAENACDLGALYLEADIEQERCEREYEAMSPREQAKHDQRREQNQLQDAAFLANFVPGLVACCLGPFGAPLAILLFGKAVLDGALAADAVGPNDDGRWLGFQAAVGLFGALIPGLGNVGRVANAADYQKLATQYVKQLVKEALRAGEKQGCLSREERKIGQTLSDVVAVTPDVAEKANAWLKDVCAKMK